MMRESSVGSLAQTKTEMTLPCHLCYYIGSHDNRIGLVEAKYLFFNLVAIGYCTIASMLFVICMLFWVVFVV